MAELGSVVGFADVLTVKVVALRRSDVCVGCSSELPIGTRAGWDPGSRTVRCLACVDSLVAVEVGDEPATAEPDIAASMPGASAGANEQPPIQTVPLLCGTGGASAMREYRRRSEHRDQQVRAAHPRLGGLILALTNEPTSTRNWAQGAAGERAVAATLDELIGDHLAVLHDRLMRRPDGRVSRANIDHLAVSACGVWVIDAKTHRGELKVQRSGALFSPRVEKLYIGGRDKTSLVAGLGTQVASVRAELATVNADLPVRGALCFVGTELPWFGQSIDGVALVGRRGLAKLLKRDGDLTSDDRDAIARFLATRFPAAT
jgi:Nuclease-related domain